MTTYTLWINAVNGWGMPKQAAVEKIFPNIVPTLPLET
jgi:hypothetical protein